jgi:hypothetical protein
LQREEIARDERGALDETPWSPGEIVCERKHEKEMTEDLYAQNLCISDQTRPEHSLVKTKYMHVVPKQVRYLIHFVLSMIHMLN